MKRNVLAVVFLLFLVALPLQAVQVRSVEDVIRMHGTGISAELLLEIVQAPHEPFDVTADDIDAMKEAGVPTEVIEALAGPLEAEPEPEQESDSTAALWGDWCITLDPPFPIYFPNYAFLPEWMWDPYWYMPRLDGTLGRKRQPPASEGEKVDAPRRGQRREPRILSGILGAIRSGRS
jgi:hypothetical protein